MASNIQVGLAVLLFDSGIDQFGEFGEVTRVRVALLDNCVAWQLVDCHGRHHKWMANIQPKPADLVEQTWTILFGRRVK